MRYRYILSGIVNPTDKLSDFRLIGGNCIREHTDAIRVTLNNEIKLTKYSCDNYSTTDCNIQIKELNPVVMCRMNSKLKQSKELTEAWLNGMQPHEFLNDKHHVIHFGVLSEAQYEWWWNNRKIAYRYDRLPIEKDGTILDTQIPPLLKFMDDVNKFKKAIIERGIEVKESDDRLAYWYHLCCVQYHEMNWDKFENFHNIDGFIKPYVDHINF